MYFALQEITSLAKDDERRKRKKKKKEDKRQIVKLLWAKGIAICNISVDCSIEFSGLVDNFFSFLL